MYPIMLPILLHLALLCTNLNSVWRIHKVYVLNMKFTLHFWETFHTSSTGCVWILMKIRKNSLDRNQVRTECGIRIYPEWKSIPLMANNWMSLYKEYLYHMLIKTKINCNYGNYKKGILWLHYFISCVFCGNSPPLFSIAKYISMNVVNHQGFVK